MKRLILFVLTLHSSLCALHAQTFSFDGRDKSAIQIKQADVFSAEKGYGYDFQNIVAEAYKTQTETFRLSDGIFYFSVAVPDGNYKVTDSEKLLRIAKEWGIETEGNPLSSDTFDAMDVMFLGALRDSESEMKPARNSKLAHLLRSLVPDEGTRAELVDILNNANNTLLEKEELKKTRKTINDNLARIEQDFLSLHVDIGLIEPRFDSIASSLRAWVKPKWVLVSISDGEYSRAQQYAREH